MSKLSPRVIWFTGYSGAGKSSLADAVEQQLKASNIAAVRLDGDIVRTGLCQDLTFSKADREENIRRMGHVAKQMMDTGLVVLCAFISPFRNSRDKVRSLFKDGEFIEVFVDTPLAVCEQRDVKGLYSQARQGKLKDFTGIDSPYEPPIDAEIVINYRQNSSANQQALKVMSYLHTL
jgi:adenylylsulfate kinase